jgi:hypothetical protein
MSTSEVVGPATRLFVEWRRLCGHEWDSNLLKDEKVLLNSKTTSLQLVLPKLIFFINTIMCNFLLLFLVAETDRVTNIRVFTVRYELIFYISLNLSFNGLTKQYRK